MSGAYEMGRVWNPLTVRETVKFDDDDGLLAPFCLPMMASEIVRERIVKEKKEHF